MTTLLPDSFRTVVGELPTPGHLVSPETHPFDTVSPVREGYVEREGVKSGASRRRGLRRVTRGGGIGIRTSAQNLGLDERRTTKMSLRHPSPAGQSAEMACRSSTRASRPHR
jgi:hypothetical protein